MTQHLNIKVTGRVQGVFFRATAQKQARRMNLSGFVQNMPDGSVYLEIEGPGGVLDKFVDWCRQGSKASRVDRVVVEEGKLKEFSDFTIE